MNERIKELAEQAGGISGNTAGREEPIVFFYESDLEKFAELIVRECVNEVMTYQLHNNPTREMVPFIVEDIKLHFGVEE